MQPAPAFHFVLALSLGFLLPSGVAAAGATSVPPPPLPAADCALAPGPLPTRTRAVFVLDTSGSMRGIGDGRADIFGRVRDSLNRYVRETRPDRVELLTFDAGLRSRRGFTRPAGTPEWNAALGALKADGSNTSLYRSLRAALEPLGGAQYLTTVFVLTDGIDNDAARSLTARPVTAAQALAAFGGRGPYDRLHYLALGADIPADARRALTASDYADGLRVPPGQVPDLRGVGLGGGLLRVTDPQAVPVPLTDGTQVHLATRADSRGVRLASGAVTGGQVRLRAVGPVPYGAAALLCAPGGLARQPARVLLRLNFQPPLTLLNPGADLRLARGEEAVLRYRAAPGLALNGSGDGLGADTLRLTDLPAGLSARVTRLPGAREFAVRFTNLALNPGQTARPVLTLPGGAEVALPAVQGRAGGRTPAVPTSAQPGASTPAPAERRDQARQDRASRRAAQTSNLTWLRVVALLALAAGLVAGLVAWLAARRRRGGGLRGRPQPARAAARTVSAGAGATGSRADAGPPGVEGIEYSVGRVLSLVAAGGEVTSVPTPLGGPFDLGQLARVPHLSGLRAEQHRDGLKILRVPADLEVSRGARLVGAGDVVRPGTLLGVAVARAGRAPQPPLGTLAGLGLPLTLRHEAASVRAAGPYGQHTVTLPAGLSDLGAVVGAPALGGLKVTLSGPHLLLVEVPPGLTLRRSGESGPLQPGTYLPGLTLVDLPDT